MAWAVDSGFHHFRRRLHRQDEYSFSLITKRGATVVLLVCWTVFGIWRRHRQANDLQREIDEMASPAEKLDT